MSQEIRTAAIVGSGLVGCGWAIVFALGGARVKVFDHAVAAREQVPDRVRQTLTEMQEVGLAPDIEAALARISVTDSLEEAVTGADYVQESVFERSDVKFEVSAEIGRLIAPSVVVGSSSSGIPASAFTENIENRNRFLVVHPVNPPHLIPVVELVPAPWTDTAIIPWLRQALEALGKVPVEVRREVEGFVLNRLQGALLNEAWALFEEGYASAADIDATVAHGLGLRWAFMGPLETIDLNAPGGIADYAARLEPLYRSVALSRTKPRGWSEDLIKEMEAERRQILPMDRHAARSAWRDRRLMELVAHLRKPDKIE